MASTTDSAKLIMIGDSMTHFNRVANNFCDSMFSLFKEGLDVCSRAQGGWNSRMLLGKFPEMFASKGSSYTPVKAFALWVGTNDAREASPETFVPEDEFEENIYQMGRIGLNLETDIYEDTGKGVTGFFFTPPVLLTDDEEYNKRVARYAEITRRVVERLNSDIKEQGGESQAVLVDVHRAMGEALANSTEEAQSEQPEDTVPGDQSQIGPEESEVNPKITTINGSRYHLPDRMHLNSEGYKVVFSEFCKTLPFVKDQSINPFNPYTWKSLYLHYDVYHEIPGAVEKRLEQAKKSMPRRYTEITGEKYPEETLITFAE